ncbi:MAG: DUF2723 domain-containing protein, partial [candidate division Zixibacteria bacterium]|nr:DUF2723 domain-containing protein [candidate division Zixibacteria bacterium]
VFTLLPFFDQIALRTNIISVLFSSATAVMMFLILVKLISRWNISRFITYAAAVTGGLFLGYSNTFWSNAVESEVYSTAMFLMLLMFHLTLLWMDHKHDPKGDRLLVAIAYLSLFSIGIHMTTFVITPIIFFLVMWEDPAKLKDWRLWIAGLVLALVILAFPTEIFLGAMLGWLALSIVFAVNSRHSRAWLLSAALMAVSIIGYSNQLYIPIRSTQNPAIDENNPETLRQFKYFLERKQYGQQSMVTRALNRRGQWINQLGNHERMGFWHFFREQYMNPRLWFLPTALGIFGLAQLIRRRRKEGVALLLLLLLTTLGLVWYMNFGDGSIPGERLEVRDRDYFFLPGFVFFAMCLGLGSAALLLLLEKYTSQLSNSALKKIPVYALGIALVLLPSLAISHNYHKNDRSGNWIPWDYAYNLLNSCEKDGILFTNGDNDTFPLWFLQEVEGFRKDIRVINLSLANTDWYILQLKHQMNVPITLEDNQIKWVPTVIQGQSIERPAEPYFDPVRNISHYLFPIREPNTGKYVRVQDLLIEHVVRANQWKFPVYFSTTVSSANRVGLDSHLLGQGYCYKIVPEQGNAMMDTTLSYKLIFEQGHYTGLADEKIYKDENTVGLLINYPEKMIELAGFYQTAGDTATTVRILEKIIEIYPDYWRTYAVLVNLYKLLNLPDKQEQTVKFAERRLGMMIENSPGIPQYPQYLGLFYQFTYGQQQDMNYLTLSIDYLKQSYEYSPSNPITYQSLIGAYLTQNRTNEAKELAQDWLTRNPND